MTQASLAEARENAETLERGREGMVPTSFEIILVRDLAAKFSGAKTFIEALEDAVPHFYEQVGQQLRPYVATPPKIKDGTKLDVATDLGSGSSMPATAESGSSPVAILSETSPESPELLVDQPEEGAGH